MAGSRAASAREPGQIREEAALSDTARAPRTSLAGADDRRARPGTGFKGGCTVRVLPPMPDNADLIRQLAERWNAGDFERVVGLFAEDAVLLNGPDWPEQAPTRGRDGIRSGIAEWQAAWETSEIELGRMEELGETIVMEGSWITRGRSSGVSGKMPGSVVFTFRDEKIASLEWFADYDSALAAARGA